MRRSDAFWTGPVIGLAVLVLLVGAYAWLGRPHPAAVKPSLLGTIPLAQVAGVTLRTGGKALTIYRETGVNIGLGVQWRIGGLTGQAADTTLIEGFVTSLLGLSPSRLVSKTPTASELASWGLQKPVSSVSVLRTGGRTPVELEVGNQSPVSDYYARVAGHPAVYLIGTTVASEISTNPLNWAAASSGTSSSGTSSSGTSSSGTSSSTTSSASTPASNATKG